MNKKDKIIEIIGFGIEPERAELMAQQILDLFAIPDVITPVICDCGKKVNGKWDDCCSWKCWNKKYH